MVCRDLIQAGMDRLQERLEVADGAARSCCCSGAQTTMPVSQTVRLTLVDAVMPVGPRHLGKRASIWKRDSLISVMRAIVHTKEGLIGQCGKNGFEDR